MREPVALESDGPLSMTTGAVLDPIFAPFTALIFIVPMLIGVALANYQPGAGAVLFIAGLIPTVLLGGWLTGGWILQDITLAQWHPGYFLPTVAGGLIAAGGSAAMGYDQLAMLMFGYGMVCWLVLGSILLLRLFTQPSLPTPLIPTMAIELAPPVVAGSAWFAATAPGGSLIPVRATFRAPVLGDATLYLTGSSAGQPGG